MFHWYFTNRAKREAESDSRSYPTFQQHVPAAMQMENVSALQLNRRRCRQSFREAYHAHVIGVLLQIASRQTSVQTRQTILLALNASADMPAGMHFGARVLRVFLAIVIRAYVPYRQQTGVFRGTAESADTGSGADRFPRRTIAKFYQSFQRSAVGESQNPEEFRSTATLVKIHSYSFLLFLANLSYVHSSSSVQMQDPVAFRA